MAIKTGRNSTPNNTQATQAVDISNLLPAEPIGEIEVTIPTPVEVTDPVKHGFKLKYGIALNEAPALVKTIHERMCKYERDMGPTTAIYDVNDGADNQLYLFNTFMRALGGTGNDLFMAIDVILGHIFAQQSTIYSTRMVYRFIKNIKRDQSEVDSYLKVLEIFLQIADPANRVKLANSNVVRVAVANIDPRYKDAAFALVTYLSQYKA